VLRIDIREAEDVTQFIGKFIAYTL